MKHKITQKRYRYRFKGKYADGTRKLVLEYIEKDKIVGFNMPKPKQMWDTLKCPKNNKENEDTKKK